MACDDPGPRVDPAASPYGGTRANTRRLGGAEEVLDLVIRNCRIEGSDPLVDLGIRGDRIAALGSNLPSDAAKEMSAEGRLLSPAFVQPHIHLDKVGVARFLSPNDSGTLAQAIQLLHTTKRAATVEQISNRAGEVIRLAVMAGTTFIRTHVDVDMVGGLVPLQGVLQAAQEHADICEIEIVAFPQEGIVRHPGATELMSEAMAKGAQVVGGMPHWEHDIDAARRHIDFCMELAARHGADIDMHIDETDDPSSRTFELLLEATERYGWQGKVTAGHCCAMAAQDQDYVRDLIAWAARLDVGIVTNPCTNLLLQGRGDDPPQRRGLPPVKALLEGGLRVACGQDCVADAFYPFGAADQLEVALMLCHAAQLSTPIEIDQALAAVRDKAAEVVGLEDYGLAPGCLADLIILDAEDSHEALRLQANVKWVFRRGRLIAETSVQRALHRADRAPSGGRTSAKRSTYTKGK
jgi:cytosine deaminase